MYLYVNPTFNRSLRLRMYNNATAVLFTVICIIPSVREPAQVVLPEQGGQSELWTP